MDTDSLLDQAPTPDEYNYRQTNNNYTDTPKNQESDNNENLFKTDFQNPGNNKFIIKFKGVQVCFYIFITFLMISIVFLLILIIRSYIAPGLFALIVLLNMIFLFFLSKMLIKIELIKDIEKNILKIKVKEALGCTYLYKEILLDNIHFLWVENLIDLEIKNKGYYLNKSIYFINKINNISEIDLDTSNVKDKPVDIFYSFDNIDTSIFGGGIGLQKRLNNFVGSPENDNNPLFFDIKKYMHKPPKPIISIPNSVHFSQIIKFNDFFFTYYLNSSLRRLDYSKILRLDFIYSNNFDRLFIGLVLNKTYYSTKHMIETKFIDKFILEKIIKRKKIEIKLKLLYNNNQQEDIIYTFKEVTEENQENLKDLIFLLNERYTNNNNNDICIEKNNDNNDKNNNNISNNDIFVTPSIN